MRMQRRLWLQHALAASAVGWADAARAGAETIEVNTASLAQLEALGGVGPPMAAQMIAERQRRAFADWGDLRRRVRGVGAKVAARLSAQGLRVDGTPYAANQGPASGGTR